MVIRHFRVIRVQWITCSISEKNICGVIWFRSTEFAGDGGDVAVINKYNLRNMWNLGERLIGRDDFLFWVVGGVTSGFLGLRVEVVIVDTVRI